MEDYSKEELRELYSEWLEVHSAALAEKEKKMSDTIAVPAYVRHPRKKKKEEYAPFDEIRNDPVLASEVIEAELRDLVPAIRRVQNLEMALGNPGGLVEKVLVIMSTFSHSEWGGQYPALWKGTKAEAIATGSKRRRRAS